MSKNKGLGKFVLGAGIGAGIALLFSTKKGEELRKDLKEKLDNLLVKAKDIDVKEVTEEFNKKVTKLKNELSDLDKEKALDIAKEKAEDLKVKVQELYDFAKEKGTPAITNIAKEVKKSTLSVIREVLNKLENAE